MMQMRWPFSFKSIVAVVGLLALSSAFAETIQGRVVAIADGDTLTLLTQDSQQVQIHLAGIDSPEKGQDFGQGAKANLSDLAFGREAVADCKKRDLYRRHVCVVTVDGVDVGLAQVKAGMAWWYRLYIGEQTSMQRDAYERAEAEAKAAHRGLWVHSHPVPPWDWRRDRKLVE